MVAPSPDQDHVMTSRWSSGPIPGEPMGMPGTDRPMASGLSTSSRMSAAGHMALDDASDPAGVAGHKALWHPRRLLLIQRVRHTPDPVP